MRSRRYSGISKRKIKTYKPSCLIWSEGCFVKNASISPMLVYLLRLLTLERGCPTPDRHFSAGAQEVYITRRSDQLPYRIFSCSYSKGIVNFFGSSLMESSRILRIAIFANTFVLLISPSDSFTICAIPAEKSKQISPHSSSSFAYRCTALYSYAAAAICCMVRRITLQITISTWKWIASWHILW